MVHPYRLRRPPQGAPLADRQSRICGGCWAGTGRTRVVEATFEDAGTAGLGGALEHPKVSLHGCSIV
jgi:hypothetical protein